MVGRRRKGWPSVLDRKLARDLARLWSQSLAIALVMACGVMTLILAMGAYRSLDETRAAYYERYRFAHLFASASAAPRALGPEIAAIDGVQAFEMRLRAPVIVDMPGMVEPAAGMVLSLPPSGQPRVNRLFIRAGKLPGAQDSRAIALDERFAKAHGLELGDVLRVTLAGKRLELRIKAVVLGPEFIYSPDPSSLVPDDRRYAVLYMTREALAALTGRKGAFNDLVLTVTRGACVDCIRARLDALLAPFGGRGAYGRAQQHSHAFLDSELTGLRGMASVVPPVFLAVAAFLVNMILARLVALEREQIGLMKANGYTDLAVGWHYAKFALAVALVGVAIGAAAGAMLGRGLTELYGEFYRFPFLVFRNSPDLYAIAAGVTMAAAVLGAGRAIAQAVRLPPAVAMRPPAPPRFRRLVRWPVAAGRLRLFSRLTVMALRHMMHRPLRSLLAAVAVAFAVALMVAAVFTTDSMDYMIEEQFFRAERADARLDFASPRAPAALAAIRRLPGVIAAEPTRVVHVELRHGPRRERVALTARPARSLLSRVLDRDGRVVELPPHGLMLADRLARKLGVQAGDRVEVKLIDEGGRVVTAQVAGVVQAWVGLAAYASLPALEAITGTGPRLTGAWVQTDPDRLEALYAAVKQSPGLATIALNALGRDAFRALMDENIGVMMGVYATIAVIVAFGVVYNAARIQLSERGRELASLRVLGFTRGEVYSVLMIELGLIVALAQPLGWLLGYGIAWGVVAGFESDLFRIPLIVTPRSYAWGSIVVLAAALASALILRLRINRLHLIEVLKTRE